MEGWLVALLICLAYLAVTLVTGIISGFGSNGYLLALEAIVNLAQTK